MKLNEIGKFKIGNHWIVAIEYGDFTGLSNNEIKLLKSFLNDLPENVIFNYGDGDEFAIDCISGLYAQCSEAIGIYYTED